MSFAEFQESVTTGDKLAPEFSPALRALWHEARGDWQTAHKFAQDDPTSSGFWVHAYLHRREGDFGNARYWYQRAGKAAPAEKFSLEEERDSIVRELLRG